MNSQDVLKDLDSTKFLEICTAIKNLTNFRTANLKLLLSIQIFARAILNLFENTHPPGFETLEFQNFFFYSKGFKFQKRRTAMLLNINFVSSKTAFTKRHGFGIYMFKEERSIRI